MAIIIEVKVIPSSSASKISLDKSGRIVVHVKSPAEDGKANKELIKFFAQALNIPQNEISIISGLTSRKKKIKIYSFSTLADIMLNLGFELQTNLISR